MLCLALTSRQASRHVPLPVQCIRQAVRFRRDIHGSMSFAEERKPFRAQLYESTLQRLERERAEQRRFDQSRRGSTPLGRTLAISFGWSLIFLKSSSTDPE